MKWLCSELMWLGKKITVNQFRIRVWADERLYGSIILYYTIYHFLLLVLCYVNIDINKMVTEWGVDWILCSRSIVRFGAIYIVLIFSKYIQLAPLEYGFSPSNDYEQVCSSNHCYLICNQIIKNQKKCC